MITGTTNQSQFVLDAWSSNDWSVEYSSADWSEPDHQLGPEVHEWMVDAACKGRTNLFFGVAGERPERRIRREETARKVCANCPVMLPCRALARTGRENGFWGGESEEERAAAGYPPRSISRRSVQQAAVRAEAS
jgi:WhiB family redox-sensing transcriptional regulator